MSDSTISLRDHFAGLALQGIIAAHAHPDAHGYMPWGGPAKTAEDAYRLADAMLQHRSGYHLQAEPRTNDSD